MLGAGARRTGLGPLPAAATSKASVISMLPAPRPAHRVSPSSPSRGVPGPRFVSCLHRHEGLGGCRPNL